MSFDDYGTGNCINCGFLAQRPKDQRQSACLEVTAWQRAEGRIGDTPGRVGYTSAWADFIPWCFVGTAHLAKEVNSPDDNRPLPVRTFEVITRHRACEGWYPWTEFLSPKEHHEELKMRQLEESRRQFEQRLAEDKRNWEKWLAEREIKERAQSDRVMRWLVIIGIILAILQLAGAFLAQALFHD